MTDKQTLSDGVEVTQEDVDLFEIGVRHWHNQNHPNASWGQLPREATWLGLEYAARHRLSTRDDGLREIVSELLEALEEQVAECFDEACEMCARHQHIIRKARGQS